MNQLPLQRGCPDDETLAAWHDGEAVAVFDATHFDALAAHLAGCARCADRLAALATLEQDLQSLSLVGRGPRPEFTAAVLAALPAPVPAPIRAAPLDAARAWWRRQGLAAGLVLAGLLIMLATGDALAVLGGWSADVANWFNSAAAADPSGLSVLPGSALAPEAYLGLVIGAVILALGAGTFLVKALAAEPAPAWKQA